MTRTSYLQIVTKIYGKLIELGLIMMAAFQSSIYLLGQ